MTAQLREAALIGLESEPVVKRRGLNGSDVASFATRYADAILKKRKTENDSTNRSEIDVLDENDGYQRVDDERDMPLASDSPTSSSTSDSNNVSVKKYSAKHDRGRVQKRERVRKIDLFESVNRTEDKLLRQMEVDQANSVKSVQQLEEISSSCKQMVNCTERIVNCFEKFLEKI